MLANVEDAIRWLELNNLEWWTVSLTKDDNAKVFDSIDDETVEGRKQRFRDTMRLSTGNRFIIKAKQNKQSGRGMFQEEFQNNTAALQPAQHAVGIVSGITEDEVTKRIAEALEKHETKRELNELRESNKTLAKDLKEANTAGARIMSKLEPYIGLIATSLMNKYLPEAPQVSIASIQRDTEVEDVVEDINVEDVDVKDMDEVEESVQRIENALAKWAAADPDYITLLENIAAMAASQDPMYNLAKNFLNK